MKFEKYIPSDRLKPFIQYLAIIETTDESTYTIFPSTGLVIGFQYKGRLTHLHESSETLLDTSGITGISDHYKRFRNSSDTGTVLVHFNEIGFTYFSSSPAHELFNYSISLDHVFDRSKIEETKEKLSLANNDRQRIQIVERFLLHHLKTIETDQLILQAVKMIYASKGAIRIKELNNELCISQSPFEKRFRKLVGTSPKKFASIVRFNSVLNQLDQTKSLTEICYENNFFDQAHFIKDFKKYTGDTPETFKREQ